MKKVLYYDENLQPKEFTVLKENKDGTVDIGTGKTLVVGSAVIVQKPTAGCVTLGEEVPNTATEPQSAKQTEIIKTK